MGDFAGMKEDSKKKVSIPSRNEHHLIEVMEVEDNYSRSLQQA